MARVEAPDLELPPDAVPAPGVAPRLRTADRGPAARAALSRVAERTRPVALARQRSLAVLPSLAGLLPEGLRRGTTVSVESGPGATALAMALVAGASAEGSWVGAVGVASLGLAAAVELGVAPERLLVVEAGGGAAVSVATVVAALIDAVDVVVLGAQVSASDARRLSARAREQGAVVVAMPGRWPVVADLRLRVGAGRWELPHRRLEGRRVEVVVEGRGAAALARRGRLWLPGPDGAVAEVPPAVSPATEIPTEEIPAAMGATA